MFQKNRTCYDYEQEMMNSDKNISCGKEMNNEVLIPFIVRNPTMTQIKQMKQAVSSTNMDETSPHKDAGNETEDKAAVLYEAFSINAKT